MNRNQFIRTAAIISGGLALGLEVRGNESSKPPLFIKHENKGNTTLWVESLHPYYEKKYLSERIRGFEKIKEIGKTRYREEDGLMVYESSPKQRPDLYMAFMQHLIKGNVTEKHVQIFCKQINECADRGLIEYGSLLTVSKMKLAEGYVTLDPKKGPVSKPFPLRHILMFYSASRYSLKKRKELSKGIFVNEGEIQSE